MMTLSQRVRSSPAYLLQLWRGIKLESSDLSIVVVLVQLLLDQSVASLRADGMIATDLIKLRLLRLWKHDFVLFGRFTSFIKGSGLVNHLLDCSRHHCTRRREVHYFFQGTHDLLLAGASC